MQTTQDDLYTMILCQEDWQRVIQALRNEAFALTQDSNRAHEKGAQDYATLLWEECAIYNALADDISWKIPE
jgi:hypothetical protein